MLFLVTVSFAQELYALPPAHAHREVEWVDEGTYVLPPPGAESRGRAV
ncbi:MAG: hypothetical protein H6736_08910 [Alphaproteobacteria bacterium]|nr:hypothetical protein [Alphaproteobacteria bacterium]MCB9691922.1 hypothetical protein [Alphaproteobacteria bacterium]